jgi:predicted dehydrogenase
MKPLVDLCIFGLGPWGLSYLKTLRQLSSARVVALCDPAPAALARALAVVDGVAGFTDETEAFAHLAGRWPAGVIVATPVATHAGLARRALEHELGVLVEKPLATTRFEADRLLRLPRAAELGAVGHLLLHHPAVQELRALLASHRIGEVRRIDTLRTSQRVDRAGEPGTPALWHLAPHDVAIALFLADASPSAVRARMDGALLVLELAFASGFSAHVRVARGRPANERSIRIEGDRAILSFDEQRGTLQVSDEPGERVFPTDLLRAQAQAFVDQLAGRSRPCVSFRSGRDVVTCLEAGEASLARDGEWMRVDAVAEWHTSSVERSNPRASSTELAEKTRRAG